MVAGRRKASGHRLSNGCVRAECQRRWRQAAGTNDVRRRCGACRLHMRGCLLLLLLHAGRQDLQHQRRRQLSVLPQPCAAPPPHTHTCASSLAVMYYGRSERCASRLHCAVQSVQRRHKAASVPYCHARSPVKRSIRSWKPNALLPGSTLPAGREAAAMAANSRATTRRTCTQRRMRVL